MLLCQTAEVDDGVAHAAEGGVDAYAGAGGDVFEVAFAVVTQNDHATLFGRKHLDEFADVLAGLFLHHDMLGVLVGEFEVVEHIALGTVGYQGHLVVAAEMVYNEVVGNTHHPMYELVLVFVLVGIDGDDDLVEGVLKDIVGCFLVFDHGKDVAVDLGLVALEEHFEARGIALTVAGNQLVVCQLFDFYIRHFQYGLGVNN